MTKQQVRDWAKTNNLDADTIIDRVDAIIKETHMSWQSLCLKKGTRDRISCTGYGYRKLTTGEYVPNAYRDHFGWKNTYYQPAMLEITIAG